MMSSGLPRRYAKALFDAAREDGVLDRVEADMRALGELKVEDPAFHHFLYSPEVLTESKIEFIEAVFGPRVQVLVMNLMRLLIERGRIGLMNGITEAFRELAEEYHGILRARVVTAVPLEGEQQARLKREMDRLTGKDVRLETVVDPSVIGGVVVHLGDRIVDGSLRFGLKKIGASLYRTEVN